MKRVLAAVWFLLAVGCALPALGGDFTITELAVTTKVSKGKPIDSVRRISHRSVKALYCFTRTLSDEPIETKLKHVWLQNGQKVKETELPVKGRRWRVYSTLPVSANSVGNWRVEVQNEAGTVLKTVEFRIQ